MSRLRLAALTAALALVPLLLGCGGGTGSDSGSTAALTDTLTLETKADSVAYRLLEAHGADALASARYLRFNFGVESPNGSQTIARHLWDRTTGEYRVEWNSGPDSSYVALVNVRDVTDGQATGTVYLNGSALSGAAAEQARQTAYQRFINDTYWLLAPLKTFDPGVNRSYVADSSTAEHDVIRLTFGDVGLTPGDTYWLYVSTDTGQLDKWAFHLQSMPDEAPAQPFHWTGYKTLDAPEGPVRLAARKEAVGGEQALLTNQLALPETVPDDVFSDPEAPLRVSSE